VRDVYGAAGYVAVGSEDYELYKGLYERDPIAGAIIDVPTEDTWSAPPEIVEQDRPDGTAFTRAIQHGAARTGLWRAMANVDRVAGIGRYAVLQLGMPGDSSRPPLSAGGITILHWSSVWSEGESTILGYDDRSGLPHSYRLRTAERTMNVHASRTVHVPADGSDPIFGRPRLRRALNVLADILKISSSTGEAYWQSVQSILAAKLDPNAELSADQLDKLSEDLGAMMHDLRRHFLGRGVELSRIEAAVPNPSQTIELLFSLVAAASGIPRRRLFGSERGELASSQDEGTYLAMIGRRQRLYAEQIILRPTLDRLIELGVVPRPAAGDYQVIWPELSSPTAEEAAKANGLRAEAAAKLAGLGGDPLSLIEIDEDRNVWLLPRRPGEAMPEPELPGPREDEGDEPEPGLDDG
jgi:hypothetical protein